MKKPFLFSNSSTKEWDFCKRAFFLRYLYLGTGVQSMYPDEDLIFGSLVHEVLPFMWTEGVFEEELGKEISTRRQLLEQTLLSDPVWEGNLIPPAREAKAQEWGRLFEGVCYGIRRFVLPLLRRQYQLVAAEGDAVRWVDEGKVGLVAKPDTILYGKEPENPVEMDAFLEMGYPGVGYLEWKTVASPSAQWQAQWVKNPQAWTGALTLKAALGVELDWFMVCGLVKGVDRDGRRSSPWCWVYRCEGETKVRDKWQTEDGVFWSADYTNAKGWERVSSDCYPGGIRQLVSDMPEEVVAKQYVLTPPDDFDWDLAEEWLRNQMPLWTCATVWQDFLDLVDEGVETPERLEELKVNLFPRSLQKCNTGAYGKPCGLKRLCHDHEVQAEPLAFYRRRVPHHELEKKE